MLFDGRDLKINPKFESCIPPLTEEEFKQLRDNIMESAKSDVRIHQIRSGMIPKNFPDN